MPLPKPEPGLVISYAYLWRHEHNKGLEEGRKTRPCVVVLSVRADLDGNTRVTVAAITHAQPAGERTAIEMPPRVKQALGLNSDRSWIILDEVNQFVWPGFDLRPIFGSKDRFSFGLLPPRLYDQIVAGILDNAARRKLAVTKRD